MATGDDDGGPSPPWSRNAGRFDKPTSTAHPAPAKVEPKPRAAKRVKAPARQAAKPGPGSPADIAARTAKVKAQPAAKPAKPAAKRSAPAKVPPAKEPRKPRQAPKPKPKVKPALAPPPTATIIRPAAFAPKAQEPAPAAATATPGLKPGQVDLAAAEQSLGHVRADIVARLVSDGAPLDRARQFADLILEYAACTVSIDRWGPVTMGNESAWATRRDKVRKALGEFRLIDATWLWELMP